MVYSLRHILCFRAFTRAKSSMIELTSIVRSNSLSIHINVSMFRRPCPIVVRWAIFIRRSFENKRSPAIRDHQTEIHAQQYLHVWKARLHGILPDYSVHAPLHCLSGCNHIDVVIIGIWLRVIFLTCDSLFVNKIIIFTWLIIRK